MPNRKVKVWSRVFILIPCLLLSLSTFATSPAPVTKLTHEYRLDNGLKLIVREDHRSPVVYSAVWYKVGGSYEANGLTGISHALEHMMFNGTRRFARGVLNKIVSENGGDLNAMTTPDYTVYYEQLAADRLPVSFLLEADR